MSTLFNRTTLLACALLLLLPLGSQAQALPASEALIVQVASAASGAPSRTDVHGMIDAKLQAVGANGVASFQARLVDAAAPNYALVEQIGTHNAASVTQSGLDNIAVVYQNGLALSGENEVQVSQLGDNNTFAAFLEGERNVLSVGQVGNGNIYYLEYAGNDLPISHSMSQIGNDNYVVQSGASSAAPFSVQQFGNQMAMYIRHNGGH